MSHRICLFHQNQAVWRAVARLGLAGAYNSREFPKLHVWGRRLLALPFLTEDVIASDFSLLFERDAINGEIHVEGAASKRLNGLFNITNRLGCENGVNMQCNNIGGDQISNRCEGFHNGLRKAIHLAHPNHYVSIELVRKTGKDSSERFCQYLRGEDVCRLRGKERSSKRI